MKLTFRAMILSICLTICAFAQVPAGDARTGTTESTTDAARLDKMPRDLEVRYALNALPPHLRDAATTYVLDRTRATSSIARERTDSAALSSARNRNERIFATMSMPRFALMRKGPRRLCRSGWTPQI